ncbi:hypothetical protein CASFOL_014843 [Castilleja foliolosa]|uniref:Trafficking protein particle complex II-specific subunit 130 homolog n=1 Tax=Castilleja foliolosa TaxID=1961234 RepID=A0ABD3DC28_9LAMI
MATFLPQFQSIKTTFDHVVLAVEDVSDLWPTVKKGFEERLPLKRVFLNNKTRNAVPVDELPAEFILTTDARLRSRFPQEQSLFWFREPYATIVLVTCEDLDEFKNILKPRLKLIVQNDEREWFIVFVSRAPAHNDQATKMAKRVYAKIEVDFSSKKRERCCKLDINGPEANFWEDLEAKIMECIRNTLDRRIQFYEEEIRKLSEQRFMPVWNFCNFFILKESLAFMFEIAHLHEDALREYDELELCYLETVNMVGKQRDFGGGERGDDQATLLDPGRKGLTQIVHDDSFREFEFRQYLFACQAKLLFKLNRPFEAASRGYSFIISFSKGLTSHETMLPFCMREVWVITACLALIKETASHYKDGIAAPDVEKEFYRVQGEIYTLCRTKFMRLGYLIGYGSLIERSPVNSASLSMLPWPKPAVWPSLPSSASSEVLAKEKVSKVGCPSGEGVHYLGLRSQMILQESPRPKHFGIQRKPLPLEPSVLLREANRRRASLSAGNMLELFDGRPNPNESSGPPSSLPKGNSVSMSRTFSSPGNFDGSIDRPMRLAEIYVAAEHALRNTISDAELWTSLSSVEGFEQKYLDLSKGAASNYHRSWWKRHGVVLDGEIAAVYHKHENYDFAANLYEKVCALYAGEGWENLLAEVLPNLAECQKILNDQAGYLSSCVRLLSLDKGLFLTKERQAFQFEVVRLAHSEMEHPVPLDVSSLITFSGNQGPPLELCGGDPGTLSVTLLSEFPDDITLESLSLTLTATNNTDEGAKAIKSSEAIVLRPGRNIIILSLPPQKPGSYVLGVLTGQIGQLRFRSHSFSKGVPADADDFTSYEKPTRPILKVANPRSLVDLAAAVSSDLLMNEFQWVGIIVKPLNYSLNGAVLQIDPGPGLRIEQSHGFEIEKHELGSQNMENLDNSTENRTLVSTEVRKLILEDGKINLPDWTSNITSVLWVPLRAVSEGLAKGTTAGAIVPQRPSIVDGLRTIALKLDFGVSHNQTFGKTIAVHFTDPFHVSTHVADKCNDGTLLLQVILQSQVKASLAIYDAWLGLQDGFSHAGKGDGRPASSFFPLIVSSKSKAGILFSIRLADSPSKDEANELDPVSILNIKYTISGSRSLGAHTPVSEEPTGDDNDKAEHLTFRSEIVLQRPVLDPGLAVGFLPLSSSGLRVGQLVTMNWRVERLKASDVKVGSESSDNLDEVLYEVNANSENWMVAGRKRGYVSLSTKQGSRIVISILCLPLVAGYVRPPQLGLPNVDEANISCNPPGPHLICVLPPALSSSYCVPA